MRDSQALSQLSVLDRYCDPKKLAYLGLMVRQRLNGIAGVERVAIDGADLYVVPGFLRKRDCRLLVQEINKHAVPSTLYEESFKSGFRTSWTHHFKRDDPLTYDLESYICELLGIGYYYSEPVQGQRYQAGQEYKAHYDYFPVTESYWSREAPAGGQRTWTAMIFLNEPSEGGETEFPRLGVTLKPQTGTLALWNNMDASGRPNNKTLHAAKPVKRGIKHVITKWFRLEPWHPTDL